MSNDPNFVASTHQGTITIKRSSEENHYEISMVPNEVDRATNLVGSALSVVSLSHPNLINYSPFVVRFFEDNTLVLERSDQKGSVPFTVNEGDELIKTIHMGLGMCLNERTHGRALPVKNSFMEGMMGDEPL